MSLPEMIWMIEMAMLMMRDSTLVICAWNHTDERLMQRDKEFRSRKKSRYMVQNVRWKSLEDLPFRQTVWFFSSRRLPRARASMMVERATYGKLSIDRN